MSELNCTILSEEEQGIIRYMRGLTAFELESFGLFMQYISSGLDLESFIAGLTEVEPKVIEFFRQSVTDYMMSKAGINQCGVPHSDITI